MVKRRKRKRPALSTEGKIKRVTIALAKAAGMVRKRRRRGGVVKVVITPLRKETMVDLEEIYVHARGMSDQSVAAILRHHADAIGDNLRARVQYVKGSYAPSGRGAFGHGQGGPGGGGVLGSYDPPHVVLTPA